MKNATPRMRLACILVLTLTAPAFGQQAAKGLFNPEANVQYAATYIDRGLAKQKKGDLDGATADYNQAIRLKPDYAQAYDNRGNVKLKRNDLDGAIADFDQAIRLDRNYALAYRNRGNAKRKKGDVEAARSPSGRS
jgi:tetratricopeptide (TPR) repeat protein